MWGGTLGMQEDPLNLSLGGVDGFKTNIGARIKFLLFTLHADYTVAEYNMFTIGIGLNSDIGSRIIGGSIEKATKKDKKKEPDELVADPMELIEQSKLVSEQMKNRNSALDGI